MTSNVESALGKSRPPTSLEVEAARLILKRMNIDLEDLAKQHLDTRPAPTFAEYIPVVAAAVGAGTLRTYRPYWERIKSRWGNITLGTPSPSEIKQLAREIQVNTVVRRNA